MRKESLQSWKVLVVRKLRKMIVESVEIFYTFDSGTRWQSVVYQRVTTLAREVLLKCFENNVWRFLTKILEQKDNNQSQQPTKRTAYLWNKSHFGLSG